MRIRDDDNSETLIMALLISAELLQAPRHSMSIRPVVAHVLDRDYPHWSDDHKHFVLDRLVDELKYTDQFFQIRRKVDTVLSEFA